jgi:hypothetical protein
MIRAPVAGSGTAVSVEAQAASAMVAAERRCLVEHVIERAVGQIHDRPRDPGSRRRRSGADRADPSAHRTADRAAWPGDGWEGRSRTAEPSPGAWSPADARSSEARPGRSAGAESRTEPRPVPPRDRQDERQEQERRAASASEPPVGVQPDGVVSWRRLWQGTSPPCHTRRLGATSRSGRGGRRPDARDSRGAPAPTDWSLCCRFLSGFTISAARRSGSGAADLFLVAGAPPVGEWGTISFVPGADSSRARTAPAIAVAYAYMQTSALQTYSIDLRFPGGQVSRESGYTYSGGSMLAPRGSLGYTDGDVVRHVRDQHPRPHAEPPGNRTRQRTQQPVRSVSQSGVGLVGNVELQRLLGRLRERRGDRGARTSTGWLVAFGVLALATHSRRLASHPKR